MQRKVATLAYVLSIVSMSMFSASAESVPVQSTATTTYDGNNGYGVTVTMDNRSEGTLAVPFITTITSGATVTSLTTYCVDLYVHTTGATQTANVYSNFSSTVNDSSGYSRDFGRAGWLVDTYSNQFDAISDEAERKIDRSALQIAIWKAVYETDTTKLTSLDSGFITFSGLDQNVANQAVSLLTALYNGGDIHSGGGLFIDYPLVVDPAYPLEGNQNQDMLGANAVPEPSTFLMISVAGLIFGGVRFRGRSWKQAA